MNDVTPMMRRIIKRLLPKALLNLIRGQALFAPPFIWDGIYARLRDVPVQNGNYDDPRRVSELHEQASGFLQSVRADRAIRLWHEHLAMLAAAIGASTGRVRVLDYGGGMGTGFIQLFVTLPSTVSIHYEIIELEQMCSSGRQLFGGDPRIRYVTEIPDAAGNVDIVYVNSALQYVPDYAGLLRRLAALNAPYLLFARFAAGNIPTYATRQLNLPGQVLPYWFLNIGEVSTLLRGCGYTVAFDGLHAQEYDQSNFPPTHRLGRMRNILFVRDAAGAEQSGEV